MDDFIYGEPRQAIPAPAALTLLGVGLVVVAAARPWSGRRRA
jgi:hypothetical protein